MYQYCMVIIAGLFLAACGKKGPLEPLEESQYPRTYPKPACSDPFPPKKPIKRPETKDCCDE